MSLAKVICLVGLAVDPWFSSGQDHGESQADSLLANGSGQFDQGRGEDGAQIPAGQQKPSWTSTSLQPPYARSPAIASIAWHWETYTTAAFGSDLWPVAWGPDDHLYAAWGDGGGFGGSDSDGRVAMGFARIEGGPGPLRGVNLNGGKDATHAGRFPREGKTTGQS